MENIVTQIDDLESLSNNEILFKIQQLEADHTAIKTKMLNDYDRLVDVEKKFDIANKIISKRLKGE